MSTSCGTMKRGFGSRSQTGFIARWIKWCKETDCAAGFREAFSPTFVGSPCKCFHSSRTLTIIDAYLIFGSSASSLRVFKTAL